MRYLIDGQSIWIPGFDARLVDVHHGHRDTWTHLRDHAARRATHVPGADAADSLYLKHLKNVDRDWWKGYHERGSG